MKIKLILSAATLLLFPAISQTEADWAPSFCSINPVVIEEKEFDNYHIVISRDEEWMCVQLDIEKDGQNIYHQQDIGTHFYFGSNFEKHSNGLIHLTDIKKPNLVISEWTGGMHCCYYLHVFELGDTPRKIASLGGQNYYPEIKDYDQNGIYEIKITDDFLAYRFASFALSAVAKVVLKFNDGHFAVAPEYMVQPISDLSRFKNKIPHWQKIFAKESPAEFPPRSFVQTITNLFFSGNQEIALELIDSTWPEGLGGKEKFLSEYREALSESNYYNQFVEQITQ